MKNKLFFFGRFPAYKEVGGVTTFTYNFASKFKDHNLKVVDFYPAKEKKIPDGVSYQLIIGGAMMRLFKIFMFCSKNNGNYIFNFSSVRSLLLMAILPKRSNTKWISIFHNGEQQKNYKSMTSIERFVFRKCINKIDIIAYLSQKQYDFFKQFNVSNLQRVSPYIAKEKNSVDTNPKLSINKKSMLNVLITGFPTKIYRIIETIEMLNKLRCQGIDFNLHVCLYGFDSEGYKQKILTLINTHENIFLHEHLDDTDFNQLLNETNIYLRLNSVDSFGLVVAEAIEKNIIVIATDVCERYPGALLVSKDDFTSVYTELLYLLRNRHPSGQLPIQAKPNGIVSYHKLLKCL